MQLYLKDEYNTSIVKKRDLDHKTRQQELDQERNRIQLAIQSLEIEKQERANQKKQMHQEMQEARKLQRDQQQFEKAENRALKNYEV